LEPACPQAGEFISKPARYEGGSTVLTTNQVFQPRPVLFNNDSPLASAVLNRLLHQAEVSTTECPGFAALAVFKPVIFDAFFTGADMQLITAAKKGRPVKSQPAASLLLEGLRENLEDYEMAAKRRKRRKKS